LVDDIHPFDHATKRRKLVVESGQSTHAHEELAAIAVGFVRTDRRDNAAFVFQITRLGGKQI
jgi:hypothetical protein